MPNLALTFTNRETYLAWRANWRATYKALSAEIREGKQAQANAFRTSDPKAQIIQRDLSANRSLANRLMELRKEAKELSAEQRLAGAKQSEAA